MKVVMEIAFSSSIQNLIIWSKQHSILDFDMKSKTTFCFSLSSPTIHSFLGSRFIWVFHTTSFLLLRGFAGAFYSDCVKPQRENYLVNEPTIVRSLTLKTKSPSYQYAHYIQLLDIKSIHLFEKIRLIYVISCYGNCSRTQKKT